MSSIFCRDGLVYARTFNPCTTQTRNAALSGGVPRGFAGFPLTSLRIDRLKLSPFELAAFLIEIPPWNAFIAVTTAV